MMIYIIMQILLPLIILTIVLLIEILLSVEIIAFNYTDSNKVVMVNVTLMEIQVIKRIYK